MLEKGLPVLVSHGDNANRWDWLQWGPDYPNRNTAEVPVSPAAMPIAEPGIYTFYIAGRNRMFCVDRISVYRKLGVNQFPAGCLSTTAETSLPVAQTPVLQRAAQDRGQRTSIAQNKFFDIRGRTVAPAAAGQCAQKLYTAGNGKILFR
jgi:hypothetical protein